MAKQIRRRVDVVVGTTRVTALRCSFQATKTLKKEPNTLDLRVWNLNDEHRALLQGRGIKVLVLAGYEEQELAQVFSGDSRTCDHVHQGPDFVTLVQCGDGEEAYRTARVAESFGPGVQLVELLEACARALGVGLGNLSSRARAALPRAAAFPHGRVLHGSAVAELDNLVRSTGLSWSIQDGQLQLLAPGETNADLVPLLSPTTGLVGSPQHGAPDKKGGQSVLKVRCLLQPRMRPGSKFELRSESASGPFRAEKVVHIGDTHSQDWYSDLEAKPIS